MDSRTRIPDDYVPTVLHVEDREANRHLRRRLMERAGLRVLEAATMTAGLQIALEQLPDVVLTDVTLPDGSGFELTRQIKANPRTVNVRVVQISAVLTDPLSRARGLDSGADAYLIEPADATEFIAILRAVIRGRHTEDLLQKTTQALRLSEEQLRTVIDNTPALVYVVDAGGRFLLANRAFCSRLGVDPEDVAGRRLEDLFPPETASQLRENNQRILELNTATEYEEVVPHRGVPRTYLSVKAPLLGTDGRPFAICGVSTDITERKRVETSLQVADRRKDAFIATVAHELRQPLAPIMTALELLQRTTDSTIVAQAHRVLERQVNQMRRLIDDLLDASRIAQGKVTIRPQRVNVPDAVRTAVNTMAPLARDRNQEIGVEVKDDPLFVEADPDRLQQVLSNLLTNSVKYTGTGGRITARVERAGAAAAIHVADTGRGIPPELLPHVFDLFTTASTEQGGLGVGLAVVRGLVERHGGTIEASSAGVGQGSAFTVRLPIVA